MINDPQLLIKVYEANLACAPSASRRLRNCIMTAHGYTTAIWVQAKRSYLASDANRLPVPVSITPSLIFSPFYSLVTTDAAKCVKSGRGEHYDWLTKW